MLYRVVSGLSRTAIHYSRYQYHRDADQLPRQYNFKWTKEEKKVLFGRRPRPKIQMHFDDILALPGDCKDQIATMHLEFMERNDIIASPDNVAMLIYLFIQNKLMSSECFDKIQKFAYQYRGQYKLRAVFGGLYGAVMYDRKKLTKLFVEEYQASKNKFSLQEMLQMAESLSMNQEWSEERKLQFWTQHFKADFQEGIQHVERVPLHIAQRLYKAFVGIKMFDEQIWAKIIGFMSGRKGWARISLMEKLYAVSGTLELAHQAFSAYYEQVKPILKQMTQEDQILRRYNFSQMRLYTPKQLFKIADENQDNYFPKERTLVPQEDGQDPAEWNRLYEEWLLKGEVKQEEQIIRDKSDSFGYAIKDRFEEMQADNLDTNKLSSDQYIQLFGAYDKNEMAGMMAAIKKEEAEAEEEPIEEEDEPGNEKGDQ